MIVLFTIPTAVVLSMWIGVCGCGCPNLERASRTILASFVLRNNAPSSASAAEDATSLIMAHVTAMLPLCHIGPPSRGILPMKKYPQARLWPLPADK